MKDLNVKRMMKNCHLEKAVASQKSYAFKMKVQTKCKELAIKSLSMNGIADIFIVCDY